MGKTSQYYSEEVLMGTAIADMLTDSKDLRVVTVFSWGLPLSSQGFAMVYDDICWMNE